MGPEICWYPGEPNLIVIVSTSPARVVIDSKIESQQSVRQQVMRRTSLWHRCAKDAAA